MTKDKQTDSSSKRISTDGGTYVKKDVNTDGGDFVGRDKITTSEGDLVERDKIINIVNIVNHYINTLHNWVVVFLVVLLFVVAVVAIVAVVAVYFNKSQSPFTTPTPLLTYTSIPTNTPTATSTSIDAPTVTPTYSVALALTALVNQENTTPAPNTPEPPTVTQVAILASTPTATAGYTPVPNATPTIPILSELAKLEMTMTTAARGAGEPVKITPTDTPTAKSSSDFAITMTALENQGNTTPAPNTPERPTNTNTPLPAPNTPEPPTSTDTPLPAPNTPEPPTSTDTPLPAPNTPEPPTVTQVAMPAYTLRLFEKLNGNNPKADFQIDMVNTSCGLANIVGSGIFLLDETDLVQQVTNLKSGFKGAGLPEFLDLLKVYNDDAKVIGFLASSSEQLIVIQDKNLRLYLVEETVQQIPSLADLPITQNQEVMCIGDVNEVRSFQFILQALVGQYLLLLIQN